MLVLDQLFDSTRSSFPSSISASRHVFIMLIFSYSFLKHLKEKIHGRYNHTNSGLSSFGCLCRIIKILKEVSNSGKGPPV